MIHHLDPHAVHLPAGHDRALDGLDLRDLSASIAETGQQVPAICRPTPDGPELVCGARRLLVARALNLPLLAELREMDEEAAFVLRDTENRHRADLCDLDRAQSYADALARHFDGNQSEMAKRLGVSEAHLSRLLVLARMPESVVAAFSSRAAIRECHARALSRWLHEPRLVDVANRLAGRPAAKLVKEIVQAMGGSSEKPVEVFRFHSGTRGIEVRPVGRRIRIEFDADLGLQHLHGALKSYMTSRSR